MTIRIFFLNLAGLITRRMAANLTLNLTSSTLPSSGASFFVATLTHLAAYYYSVLRPLYSDDPMLCPTCLEIRAFTIGSFTPLIMGTTTAVLGNLSTVILNKTLRLPEFHIRAYRDWQYFFQKHAFKGMAQRHYFIYPLMNGFLASMILLGQSYYWNNGLRQHLDSLEQQSLPGGKRNKWNRTSQFSAMLIPAPVILFLFHDVSLWFLIDLV